MEGLVDRVQSGGRRRRCPACPIRKWIKTADDWVHETKLLAFYLMNTPVVYVGNAASCMPKHAPCIAKHGRASPVHRDAQA